MHIKIFLILGLISCIKAPVRSAFVTADSQPSSPAQGGGSNKTDPDVPGSRNPIVDKSSLSQCSDWNSFLGVDDPYACHVWHILANNQSIKNLAAASGNMSESAVTKDLNVGEVYKDYTGKGVRIHLSDTGLDFSHEDISANYTKFGSRDYRNSSFADEDPTELRTRNRQGQLVYSSHGTMCGGLIGAVGNNGKGLLGVAWESTLSADNFIGEAASQTNAVMSDLYKKDSTVDIWSGSFGVPYSSVSNHQARSSSDSVAAAAIFGATQNNVLHFKANGNDGRFVGADGNMEGQASLYVINAIAALRTDDQVVDYSTPGSNLVLSGYAHKGGALGTCTTYRGGDNYTCAMNGTSSATPTVAGAAGIVTEALEKSVGNPRWTDVLYVLIKSANQNITDRSSKYSGTIGNQAKVASTDTGFLDFEHSFDHGFGVPNITAAVNLAEKYTSDMKIPNPEEMTLTEETSFAITAGNCSEQNLDFQTDFQIWSVEASVSVSNIAKSSLGLFLVSPEGKTFMVKNIGEDSSSTNMGYTQRFNVRAPMGLNAKGVWKVKACSSSGSGTFAGAQLKFYGFNDLNTLK